MDCTRNDSDEQLTERLKRTLGDERQTLADGLELLAEMDFRKAYARLGFGSLYRYCVEVLHLSEQQSYLRISVARTGRRHPEIFERIRRGELHMSGVHKMSPVLYLSEEPEALIAAAVHKSKREIEALLAEIAPRPDRKDSVHPEQTGLLGPDGDGDGDGEKDEQHEELLRVGRYHLEAMISSRCKELLEQARDLGAPAESGALLEAALEGYVERLLKKKLRSTSVPGRKVSTRVKRAVYERDEGRCTFMSRDGRRCSETRRLQFDHAHPVALGGSADDPDDLRLLCFAHNQYMARKLLDPQVVELRAQGFRRKPTRSSPRSDASRPGAGAS